MAINKIIFGSETLIDLTSDTITADKLTSGITAHDMSGATITGTNTYDSDTSDATVTVAEILIGKTAYARGSEITGTMPNIGTQTSSISTISQETIISQGYHDGSGTVNIDEDEQAKIIATNIKMGVEILGVTGTLEPSSSVTAQSKTVTPSLTSQTVLPDSDYDYLSQVVVNAISRTDIENSAGGTTTTIGA